MEFGLMHEFQPAPNATEVETFADSMAQVDAAEKLGLDAMWLADLHFAPQLSVLSSPLVVAGAIAAREPNQDRHGGPDCAALSSLAACRGGCDG